LNRHPELKHFIKGGGAGKQVAPEAEVNQYKGLEVKFVGGHAPELHILDDAAEGHEPTILEKISLTTVEGGLEGVRELLANKGFLKQEL